MTYTVIWRQTVLDALADLYVTLSLDDQERMAAGVKAFNTRLASNPFDMGKAGKTTTTGSPSLPS